MAFSTIACWRASGTSVMRLSPRRIDGMFSSEKTVSPPGRPTAAPVQTTASSAGGGAIEGAGVRGVSGTIPSGGAATTAGAAGSGAG